MNKTVYKCSECNNTFSKWSGKCSSCGAWNTLLESQEESKIIKKTNSVSAVSTIKIDKSISSNKDTVTKTGFQNLDEMFNGGILNDQYILIGGEPGIGKSTMILQIASHFAINAKKVLYISGEESSSQIINRMERLKIDKKKISSSFDLLNETRLEIIVETIKKYKPDLAIIDSIQTINSLDYSSPAGSPGQIKYSADILMEVVKSLPVSLILIGHVTKDGEIAGPKTLEHIVDTVINIDGDRFHTLRMVRTSKNRFGPIDGLALFNLEEDGLKEITNSSDFLLKDRPDSAIGSVLTCVIEGNRPLLIEVQALTNKTNFGYPKRTSSGIKLNRFNLITAVLQKYSKINLEDQDAYLNIIGGLNVQDPSIDLAVLLALASSFKNKALPKDLGVVGEVGLSGEIRNTTSLKKRISEMKKAGISRFITPENVKSVSEALKLTDL